MKGSVVTPAVRGVRHPGVCRSVGAAARFGGWRFRPGQKLLEIGDVREVLRAKDGLFAFDDALHRQHSERSFEPGDFLRVAVFVVERIEAGDGVEEVDEVFALEDGGARGVKLRAELLADFADPQVLPPREADPEVQIPRYNGSSLQDCRTHSCDEKADFRPLEFVNELKNWSEDQFAIQRSSGVMISACAWRSRPFSSR